MTSPFGRAKIQNERLLRMKESSAKAALKLAFSIDSSKVTAAAFEPFSLPDGTPSARLHGFAKAEAQILSPAGPVSLRQSSDAILELTEALENQTQTHFSQASLCFSSQSLVLEGSSILLPLKNNKVTANEIENIQKLWKDSNVSPSIGRDTYPYFRIRSPYRLDQVTMTKEPEGLFAKTMAQTEIVFSERKSFLLNMIEVFRICGLSVERFSPQPYASLLAATTPHERKQGIMVVDFGLSRTQVIICRDNMVLACFVLPVGSERITEDLSICLKLDPEAAERLKRATMPPSPHRTSSQESLAPEIVAARLGEIARMIRASADRLANPRDFVAGVVLVGGGSKLTGLSREFRQSVHPLCRVASNFRLHGISEILDDPSLASLAGTILVNALPENQFINAVPRAADLTGKKSFWSFSMFRR
jgi:cell division protein FtsA